jgi:HTH-type transcriptional regulator, sugar sensing transcriptional regulator
MDALIDNLTLFHFSEMEARIYFCLLKNQEMNGSQIAKALNKPRTSIYMSLDSLYKKGAVFMLPGEPVYYKPQNPKILIENLKNTYNSSLNHLEKELEDFNIYSSDDLFWNINGFSNIIAKTKEILATAEKEVFFNTNLDIQIFAEDFKKLSAKNVKIIIFSFHGHNLEGLKVDYYYNSRKVIENPYHRLMIVVDEKKVLIASGNEMEEYLATFSDNFFLVSIILEHIHNDIYLYKLDQKYGNHLLDKDIRIHSIFEKKVVSSCK